MGETQPQTSPNIAVVKESSMKKYVAELLGTFVLTFMGVGSAVFASSYIGLIGISFAFGLSLLVMVYTIGSISGCHINPAVSVSMFVAGKMKARDAVLYIVFQCVGAVLAAALVYGIAVGSPGGYSLSGKNALGVNGYGLEGSPANYSLASCFVAETVLTFLFVLVIHGSLSERVPKGFAGLSIGFSLLLVHLVDIPITNASVNPARSLGPAVFVGGNALVQLWLFWVAPIIGGILAALVWNALKS